MRRVPVAVSFSSAVPVCILSVLLILLTGCMRSPWVWVPLTVTYHFAWGAWTKVSVEDIEEEIQAANLIGRNRLEVGEFLDGYARVTEWWSVEGRDDQIQAHIGPLYRNPFGSADIRLVFQFTPDRRLATFEVRESMFWL